MVGTYYESHNLLTHFWQSSCPHTQIWFQIIVRVCHFLTTLSEVCQALWWALPLLLLDCETLCLKPEASPPMSVCQAGLSECQTVLFSSISFLHVSSTAITALALVEFPLLFFRHPNRNYLERPCGIVERCGSQNTCVLFLVPVL